MGAIIFDFDGTIADSFDYVADFLAQQAGIDELNATQRLALRNLSMAAMAKHLNFPYWRMLSMFYRGRKVMAKIITDVKPFDGLPEIIRKLHAEGHELFIVTSNSLENVRNFLHHHHLNEYFLETYASTSLFGKAGTLRRLLKDQHLKLDDVIYVGDELRDVQASKSIGMRVIAVSWGFAKRPDLELIKPTTIVDTPEQLINFLENI